jgi:hypothetical protein
MALGEGSHGQSGRCGWIDTRQATGWQSTIDPECQANVLVSTERHFGVRAASLQR